jgi:hypothetical protein
MRGQKFSNFVIRGIETILRGYEELDSGFGSGFDDRVGQVNVGAGECADYCVCVVEMDFELREREVSSNVS